MGSVAATNNNGLSDLLQTLTSENSPLLPTLSSPAIQAALENAPASDIVQISDEAVQLQNVEALLGTPSTPASPADSLFAALTSDASNPNPTTPNSLYDVFA